MKTTFQKAICITKNIKYEVTEEYDYCMNIFLFLCIKKKPVALRMIISDFFHHNIGYNQINYQINYWSCFINILQDLKIQDKSDISQYGRFSS